jgi:23S rRNA (adenine2503-C2)-methyltransferase
MEKQDIKNYTLEEFKNFLEKQSQKTFHAKQIFSWIYQKGVNDFNSMSDLPLELRNILKKNFYSLEFTASEIRLSRDRTEKFLFKLGDGSLIESALIPSEERNTVCISSQEGCKFACKFCASGINGFEKNLSTGEIVGQALFIKNQTPDKKFTHIVLMGCGEPLDNYENVLKAVRIFNSPFGFNIAARRITISTCGIIPGIKKLARENLQIELSVSLHAPDNKTRDMLMPVNKKYPLKDLIDACKQYYILTKRQITFEYILIHNLNCGIDSVKKLSALLKGFDFKLNLIPYNKIEEFDFEPPAKLEVLFFQNELSKAGIKSTLRMPRGRDISAACGQLRYRAQEQNKE